MKRLYQVWAGNLLIFGDSKIKEPVWKTTNSQNIDFRRKRFKRIHLGANQMNLLIKLLHTIIQFNRVNRDV
jgi:hypothetical protein